MNDLPKFGQNVKTIKLRPYEFSPPFNNEQNEIVWKTVLEFCPNIASIHLLKSRNILPILNALQNPGLMLNDLRKIEVKELELYSFDIQELFLRVNVRYRETITSLQLYTLKRIRSAIRRGGLVTFISQFPHLTCLKVNSSSSWISTGIVRRENPSSIVDLKLLLEEAPQLNELTLYGCVTIANGLQDTNTFPVMEHVSLIKLKIITDTITTSTLRYIVTALKQVKSLHLIIRRIIPDGFLSENEVATVLNDLKVCASKMKTVKLKYDYNSEFRYNKGCSCCRITPGELESDRPYNSDDSYYSEEYNDDDYLYDSSVGDCDDDSVFSMDHCYSDHDGDFNDYDSDEHCGYDSDDHMRYDSDSDSDNRRRNYGYDSDLNNSSDYDNDSDY